MLSSCVIIEYQIKLILITSIFSHRPFTLYKKKTKKRSAFDTKSPITTPHKTHSFNFVSKIQAKKTFFSPTNFFFTRQCGEYEYIIFKFQSFVNCFHSSFLHNIIVEQTFVYLLKIVSKNQRRYTRTSPNLFSAFPHPPFFVRFAIKKHRYYRNSLQRDPLFGEKSFFQKRPHIPTTFLSIFQFFNRT